jgi:hypothetical protein
LTGRTGGACLLGGMLDTTSGSSALRRARSIAAANGRDVRASDGAEKTLPALSPHTGHPTIAAAVPIGKHTSKAPSRGQRYS